MKKMKETQHTELLLLMRALVKWLKDYGDPHTIIIVDSERFDMYQGVTGGDFGHIGVQKIGKFLDK